MIPIVAAERYAVLPPVATSPVAMSPDFVDWPFIASAVDAIPERFRPLVADRYRNRYSKKGQQSANLWLSSLPVTVRGVDLVATDAEICQRAKQCAAEAAGVLADTVTTTDVARLKLAALCEKHGVTVPDAETLAGLIGRLSDAAWWRRQFRRVTARRVEGFARSIGLVCKHKGIYASDETVARYKEQKRRNLETLQASEAVNSEGESFNLAELAALGVSNPSVRFAELMVRVRGMESVALERGDVGLFLTGTAPSRMHAIHKKTGRQNSLFDGTDPREAQSWIGRQWGRMRAALARLGIKYYGVRVAEPHHDGTPHWHMLIFVKPWIDGGRSAVGRFQAIMRRYLLRGDWKASAKGDLIAQGRAQGLTVRQATAGAAAAIHREAVARRQAEKADTARRERAFHCEPMKREKGSAAGYLVKYLSKNISGERMGLDDEAGKPANETAGRVLAWASCWGIRQFQVVGGPAVGVWRELRRVKEKPEQLELFDAWHATGSKEEERAPDWGKFIAAQGGIECARADRPVQLWKLQEPGRRNKYGEEAGARVAGVECAGRMTATRDCVWSIRRQGDEDRKGCAVSGGREAGLSIRADGGRRFDSSRGKEIEGGSFCGELVREAKRNGVFVSQGAGGRVSDLAGFLGAKRPRTRVNNCTQRTAGAWAGIAKNMAELAKVPPAIPEVGRFGPMPGGKVFVRDVFDQLRELKHVTNGC